MHNLEEEIRSCMAQLVRQRGPEKSICPSEVARAVADPWRALMPLVRQVAAEEVRAGRLRATQRGLPVAPDTARGPIRLSLPPEPQP